MKHFDLVIIGAGIVGTLAAFYAIKRHKKMRILLVDKNLVGGGATQFSLGLDYPFGNNIIKKVMSDDSIVAWQELNSYLPNLRKELSFYGIVSTRNLKKILDGLKNKEVEILSDNFYKNQYLSLQPNLYPDQIMLKGLHCQYNDARAIAIKLAEVFTAYGENAHLWEGIEVNQISYTNAGFDVELSDYCNIRSEKILLALGPWAPYSKFNTFFNNINIRTKKIVSLHVDCAPNVNDPLFYFFDEGAFLLPTPKASRWIFSFTAWVWDCHPDNSLLHITDNERIIGNSILNRYIPNTSFVGHGGRVFCDSYTDDWTPIVASSIVSTNLAIATGGSGSGFRLAPYMAMQALEILGV